jgi:hypothetical protein
MYTNRTGEIIYSRVVCLTTVIAMMMITTTTTRATVWSLCLKKSIDSEG